MKKIGIIFALSIFSTLALAKPITCPSASALSQQWSEDLMTIRKFFNGIEYTQDKQKYDTNINWHFIVMTRGSDLDKTTRMVNKAVRSLSFVDGPKEIYNNRYECHYESADQKQNDDLVDFYTVSKSIKK